MALFSEKKAPGKTPHNTILSFAKMLPSAFFAPVIPGWSEIADATSSALQKIYTNQEEPESALATAEKEINSILASN